MATFTTQNRKLEQTLWALGVHHLSWHKTEDGMTEWVYKNSDKVQQIVAWFREAELNRWKIRW